MLFFFPVSLLLRSGVKTWDVVVRREMRKELRKGEEKAEKGGRSSGDGKSQQRTREQLETRE